MLSLVHFVDVSKKIDYIWFETGLAYQAEREQLKYLEDRYEIEIKHYKAIKPIPLTCRTIGQPFLSKRVSNEIARGQRYNFQWEDEPYDILIKKYPKCRQFLRWWTNDWEGGSKSNFNIDHNKGLKQFMIENPPWFKISDECCHWAKKEVGLRCYKEGGYDLSLYGVRRAEGGTRATAYTNCFTDKTSKGTTEYRPLYWWKDSDKREYEERFDIQHSKCYTQMSLQRTGCPSCPYGRDFEHELDILKQYEPQMYKAVNNIFKDSYEYTRMYREFQKQI